LVGGAAAALTATRVPADPISPIPVRRCSGCAGGWPPQAVVRNLSRAIEREQEPCPQYFVQRHPRCVLAEIFGAWNSPPCLPSRAPGHLAHLSIRKFAPATQDSCSTIDEIAFAPLRVGWPFRFHRPCCFHSFLVWPGWVAICDKGRGGAADQCVCGDPRLCLPRVGWRQATSIPKRAVWPRGPGPSARVLACCSSGP